MSVQYAQYSFDAFLDSMERCGMRNVELWAGAPHFCEEMADSPGEVRRRIRELRRKMEDRGMRVVCLTPEQLNYPVNLASPDPVFRRRSVESFLRHLEYAREFGTERLFVTSGVGMRDRDREECWACARDSLATLARAAGDAGVRLSMEQLQPYESNLATTCADLERMVREVDSPHLECCVDLVAMAVSGEELQDFFDRLPGRIGHVHFADGNPSGHYVLGAGNLPLRDYLRTLEANGYEGSLTREINDSLYVEAPHPALAESVRYLREELGVPA